MLVDFYQLSSPIERVLPRICERLIEGGERLLIVADEQHLPNLDIHLWSHGRMSFLPHGVSGGARAERQPVLLSARVEAVNGARNIALVDGHWREEALAFERIFYFFGAESLEEARGAWRALAQREAVESRFWRQEKGKWVQGP